MSALKALAALGITPTQWTARQIEIRMKRERATLLARCLGFTVADAKLACDTHPDDAEEVLMLAASNNLSVGTVCRSMGSIKSLLRIADVAKTQSVIVPGPSEPGQGK